MGGEVRYLLRLTFPAFTSHPESVPIHGSEGWSIWSRPQVLPGYTPLECLRMQFPDFWLS